MADQAYFTRRIREEEALAERAADPCARAAHHAIAKLYRGLLEAGPANADTADSWLERPSAS